MAKKRNCILCGAELQGIEGSNPDPLASPDKECCLKCDKILVQPARARGLKLMKASKPRGAERIIAEDYCASVKDGDTGSVSSFIDRYWLGDIVDEASNLCEKKGLKFPEQ